jgi:hypothetical protein
LIVIAGFIPAIHCADTALSEWFDRWIARPSSAMTTEEAQVAYNKITPP